MQKRIPRSLLILIQRGKTGKDWLTIGNASFVTSPDFSQSPKVIGNREKASGWASALRVNSAVDQGRPRLQSSAGDVGVAR